MMAYRILQTDQVIPSENLTNNHDSYEANNRQILSDDPVAQRTEELAAQVLVNSSNDLVPQYSPSDLEQLGHIFGSLDDLCQDENAPSGTMEGNLENSKTQQEENRKRQPRPRRPPDQSTLPPGWFVAYDQSGKYYFYTKGGTVQWHKPTVAAPESFQIAPFRAVQEHKTLQDLIDSVSKPESITQIPQEVSTPAQDAAAKKEKWRSYPVEKQMKIYENTLFPHVKYVMDKFRHKLPKEDLKKFAKEVNKKLVASDYKNHRVEDPNMISKKQEQKIKSYVEDFFDKAVLKYNAAEKKKRNDKLRNGISSSPEAEANHDHDEDLVLTDIKKVMTVPLSPEDGFYHHPLSITYASKGPPCEIICVGNIPNHWSDHQLQIIFSRQPGFKWQRRAAPRLPDHTVLVSEKEHARPVSLDCLVCFENIAYATTALRNLSQQRSETSQRRRLSGSQEEGTPPDKITTGSLPNSDTDFDASNISGSHLESIRIPGYTATDSGYGSLSAFKRLPNTPDAVRIKTEKDPNFPNTTIPTASSEAGTVFSAATTMLPEIVSDSVMQICEGISQKLQLEQNTSSLGAIVGNLGELIKAFAIQLGLDQSHDLGPSIMYFVYKHHHAICALLKEKLMEEDDDTKSQQSRSGDMSLAEKMALFNKEGSGQGLELQDSFEGVDDLEDDNTMSTMDLSNYSRLILQSSAYRWLISTLKSQASLSYGDGRATMDFMDGNNDDACATVQGQDHLKIKVYSVDGGIRVTCSGSSYLVSQCAAQVAWISCALRSGGSRPLVCTPQLIQTGVAEFAVSHLWETAERQSILAHVEIAGQLRPISTDDQVSVWGFPTALRPESFSGVEIPLDLPHDSAYPFFQESNGHLIFNIGGKIAYFVDRKNDIWLWHLAPSLEDVCSCVPDISESSARIATPRGSKVYDFFQNRHIFSRCYQGRRSFQDCMNRSTQEEETDSDRDEDRTMIKSPGLGSLQSDFPTKHSTESDSIDTDLLSISSFSCDSDDSAPELHGDMAVIVESTAQNLFSSFQQSLASTDVPCDGDSTENSRNDSRNSVQTPSDRSANSGVNPRKRKTNDREEEDGDASRQNHRPEKQPKIEESPPKHNFACPFWKHDRVNYQSCLRAKLLSSSRVKQHLKRIHTPQFYCQFCYVIFKDSQAQEQHVVQRSCERLTGAKFEGITPDQEHELSRKPKSEVKLTEEQKWYRIWAIVFPNHPRPRSPYIDIQLTDDLASFQEHWQARGPEILEREIQSSGILPYPTIAQAQLLRSVLTRGLDMIRESWTIAQQNPSSQAFPATPAYTLDHSSIGPASSTTPSHSSIGVPTNLPRDRNINPTMLMIDQTEVAVPGPSTLRYRSAESTNTQTEAIPPNANFPAVERFAPPLDPNDILPFDDTDISKGIDSPTTGFGELFEWPNGWT
ncbi:histone methyltransferase set2 [Neopestalotiopsis sp. 37M]|nr:histone methyltransferase set2 [Neopestalotiopsis sp. 37M]